MPVVVQRLAPGTVRSVQAALGSHSCCALAVGTAAGGGGRRGLSAFSKEIITQVMSSCKLVSVTALHAYAAVDIHTHNALSKTTTNNTTTQHDNKTT